MADSFEHFQQQMSDMFTTLFRQDDPTQHNDVDDDEKKPLDKTADMTDSSFMYDPSTSFASWLSSQDYDGNNIVVPSLPNSPHLLGDDDDESYIDEGLRYNDGTSPERYDGSKPFVEWLSSRDADNVVLSPQRRKAQFEGHMSRSSHAQVEGGNKGTSLDCNDACNEQNNIDAIPTTVLKNICDGNEITRIISESCGCTIITQINDLLDTRHCNGDIHGHNDDYHQNEICVNEAVDVSFEPEIHHKGQHDSNEEETSTTEREEMEEIRLDDSFETSLDDSYADEIHNSKREEEDVPVDEMNIPAATPENMLDKQLNDGEEALYAPEREEEEEEEDCPMDEMNAPAVTPTKLFENRLDERLDDGPRKKLSQMLLETSVFSTFQPNNCRSSANSAWRSVGSFEGDDINTVDLESLDDALNDDLNNHVEIFRDTKPRARRSPLTKEVHLLGASLTASSASSDHDSIFERVLSEENRSKRIIAYVNVSPLKKVAETRASFLERTQDNSRREDDNHARRSSISSEEKKPKGEKENTIISISVRGRKGKNRYARHARQQRLSSKAASLQK